MIIACNACPAQYSVPDAKVRGKRVRITCKHCAAVIVVDATHLAPLSEVAAPPAPPKFEPPKFEPEVAPAGARADDVTKVTRPKPGNGFSVHDEPTVIGQIPKEALDFERALSQRTVPPPVVPPAPESAALATSEVRADSVPPESPRRSALAEVPESPDDETKRASPRAFALPAPSPLIAEADAKRDDRTLVSASPQAPIAAARGPRLAWLAVVLLALSALAILKLR